MNLIDTIEISSGSRGTTIEFARLAEDGKTVANVKEYKPSKPLCEWLEELMHCQDRRRKPYTLLKQWV